MKPIRIPSSTSNPISIRIDAGLLKEIDDVTVELKGLTNNSISRNQLIELMLMFASENAVFDVNGQEMSFKMILNSFRAQNLMFQEMLPTSEDLEKESEWEDNCYEKK